jgi:DNA mismatch repair protein MSH2
LEDNNRVLLIVPVRGHQLQTTMSAKKPNTGRTTSPLAMSLVLEDAASVQRYAKSVERTAPPPGTLRIFEHLNRKIYTLHGPACVSLAAALNVEDMRAAETLVTENDSIVTLALSPRAARDLAAAALFSAGKKITLLSVKAGGATSVVANASPGSIGSLADYLDLDVAAANLPSRPLLDEGCVVAVKISANTSGAAPNVGVVAWDASRSCLSMTEIHDDEAFSALEGILVSVNAKELLMCANDVGDHEAGKMASMLENCGVARTELPKKDFAPDNVATDLERLVGSHLPLVKFLGMTLAIPAIASLLSFTNLTASPSNDGVITVDHLDHASFMQLDTAALRALNVVPFTGDGGGGKRATLYGLLNRTKTPMGSRLLRRWLAQPLQDLEAINARLDATEAFIHAVDARGAVRDDHLQRLPDLNQLCLRFTKNNGAKASLQDVVRLYQSSVRLPYLVKAVQSACNAVLDSRFADPLDGLLKDLANFEALVETTIDLDQIDNGEFVINPKIDVNLADLRVTQDSLLAEIADEHKAVIRAVRPPKEEALKLERKDNLGYVFRLTRKDEKFIRGKSAYQVVDTRKDGVRFVTRSLKKLSIRYDEAAREYSGKETELRAKTLEVAATYMESFTAIAALAAEIDVVSSFATVAVGARDDYIRPVMVPAGQGLVLKNARHAMVEECLDDKAFIANDMDMRSAAESGEGSSGALLLITGPNTGGKSTYIRTAGVCTLMAHIGSFVPAAEASVPITDRILCRVGAGDNQHRAVSTFMSEMLETATILRLATPHSLIIIDGMLQGRFLLLFKRVGSSPEYSLFANYLFIYWSEWYTSRPSIRQSLGAGLALAMATALRMRSATTLQRQFVPLPSLPRTFTV